LREGNPILGEPGVEVKTFQDQRRRQKKSEAAIAKRFGRQQRCGEKRGSAVRRRISNEDERDRYWNADEKGGKTCRKRSAPSGRCQGKSEKKNGRPIKKTEGPPFLKVAGKKVPERPQGYREKKAAA